MQLDRGDCKMIIGRVIIASRIHIATTAVTRIGKALRSLNTPLWHRNGIQNVKELIHVGFFVMLRYRVLLDKKSLNEA